MPSSEESSFLFIIFLVKKLKASVLYCVSDSTTIFLLMNIFYLDVDECSSNETNSCQFACINTIGSYKCACPTGYHLSADGKKCEGNTRQNVIRITCTTVTGGVGGGVGGQFPLTACSRASRRALSVSSNVSCMRIMVQKCYNPTIV